MIDHLFAVSILSGLLSPDVDPLVYIFDQLNQLEDRSPRVQPRLNEVVDALRPGE